MFLQPSAFCIKRNLAKPESGSIDIIKLLSLVFFGLTMDTNKFIVKELLFNNSDVKECLD